MSTKLSNEDCRKRKEEERKGFRIHTTVYICVTVLLFVINLVVSPEFMWFLFPLVGMGIGLAFHYFIGIKKGKLC